MYGLPLEKLINSPRREHTSGIRRRHNIQYLAGETQYICTRTGALCHDALGILQSSIFGSSFDLAERSAGVSKFTLVRRKHNIDTLTHRRRRWVLRSEALFRTSVAAVVFACRLLLHFT